MLFYLIRQSPSFATPLHPAHVEQKDIVQRVWALQTGRPGPVFQHCRLLACDSDELLHLSKPQFTH